MSALQIIPRCSVSIRPAISGDYAFVDRLQQMHSKAVGFMRKSALEGKIGAGHVLIAEDEMRLPIGYVIAQDRYFKRDDVGIVYQMNVSPGAHRKLVGAMLLKAVFERAAYGCKLFCCWCAQDLDANYFWESMGFVPLAFRTGAAGTLRRGSGQGKTRTHIFWQRRIREGDTTTPYWFPSKTDGGMMREDRLVLPIPPGVHWKDEMPVLLPEVQKALPCRGEARLALGDAGVAATKMPKAQKLKPRVQANQPLSGFSFTAATPVVDKARRAKKPKVKFDPAHVAKARELRDRYLEHFNAGLVLPQGKYEVSRQLVSSPMKATKLLAA